MLEVVGRSSRGTSQEGVDDETSESSPVWAIDRPSLGHSIRAIFQLLFSCSGQLIHPQGRFVIQQIFPRCRCETSRSPSRVVTNGGFRRGIASAIISCFRFFGDGNRIGSRHCQRLFGDWSRSASADLALRGCANVVEGCNANKRIDFAFDPVF